MQAGTKIYNPSAPWDFFDLSPHFYRKLKAAFIHSFAEMNPNCSISLNVLDNLPYEKQTEFRYFIAGRRSVKIWEAQKLSIITSGRFDGMDLSRTPHAHQSYNDGVREMVRLSKRIPDKPFYLFALAASAVNGATLSSTELRELTEDTTAACARYRVKPKEVQNV